MNQPLLLSALNSDGDGLRLEFSRQGDRYTQQISAVVDGKATPLLKSLEGDGAETWPPSPPLQQLSIEPREPGAVALLVGMAGKSHWSLSVEASPGKLLFDAACRAHGAPEFMGSSYTPIGPLQLNDRLEVTITPVASDSRLQMSERCLQVSTASGEETPSGALRWSYSVRLVDLAEES